MNKKELKEQVSSLPSELIFKKVMVNKDSVLGLIDQLDEPKRVVIPKFMAEWIKQNRHKTLFSALGDADWNNSPWIDWVQEIGDTATPQEIFARAWLDGYEIEKREAVYGEATKRKRMVSADIS